MISWTDWKLTIDYDCCGQDNSRDRFDNFDNVDHRAGKDGTGDKDGDTGDKGGGAGDTDTGDKGTGDGGNGGNGTGDGDTGDKDGGAGDKDTDDGGGSAPPTEKPGPGAVVDEGNHHGLRTLELLVGFVCVFVTI